VHESLAATTRTALHAELAQLTTEEMARGLDDLDQRSSRELVELMNAYDHSVAEAVSRENETIAHAVDAIVHRLSHGGRLIYCGAGTAGRLGVLDASECPPTFNTDPGLVIGLIAGGERAIRHAVEGAEDDSDAGAADLAEAGLTADDVVVGVSASGRTPYVLGAVRYAAGIGACTIAVACNRNSRIGAAAEHAIEVVVGPEVIAGSTRLKAGTAQKLVLNMLSTVSMIRLGKTYGTIMVDLRATNEKLKARAERAIMAATGASAPVASSALDASGGSVKLGIAMILTGLDASDARALLHSHDGRLRSALDAAR
jgi:N-acetylmuramic acid 6-phosphate etherase